MAKQTLVKTRTTPDELPAVAPPKRATKAAAGAKAFDYTKFRQTMRREEDFAAYLAGYPDKTGLLGYIYRLQPALDLSLIGRSESYIDKADTPVQMTPEYVARKFGRGEYMFKLTDANRPKGQQEVCKTWFIVDDPDTLPVYDLRTLKLGDTKNQDEVARLLGTGALIRDANGAPKVRTEADGAQPVVMTSNGSGGDIFSKDILGQVIMKLVTTGIQTSQDSVKQAVEVARLLNPQTQPQLSVEQIVELVAARLERTVTKTNSDGDFFQTYERVEAFIQKVKGPAPLAVPEGASGWVTILGTLLERVDRWVPAIVQTMQARQAPRRVATGRRPQPGEGEQPQMTIADRINQIATLGFERMNAGINGFDFAAYVCNYMPGGLEVYQMLEPQGPPGVMGLCAMNPQTAPLLADAAKRAQVEAFLSDFFTYDPSGSSGSEVDMSSGAAA